MKSAIMIADMPVSAPKKPLPSIAWDCHAHVFGPFNKYPLTSNAAYTPPVAKHTDNQARMIAVGLTHGVLVQGAAHGFGNEVIGDALVDGKIMGVGVVAQDVSPSKLTCLKSQGFCGLRFVDNGRPAGPGMLALEALPMMSKKLETLNWQAQIWAFLDKVLAMSNQLENFNFPIVLDHMGYPPKGTKVKDPIFVNFLKLLKNSNIWVKLTPHRLSDEWPDNNDVRQLHDALIEAIPERVIWGSDWPFLHLNQFSPDLGQRIDLFDEWCPDLHLRQAIFTNNPNRLFVDVDYERELT